MKTTQPKKRGQPVGSKNKFKSNEFAKKYKTDLLKVEYGKLSEQELLEASDQVKSWSKHERAIICDNLADIVLAAVVGLIVGVLLTINL